MRFFEYESREILRREGIPVADGGLARSAEEAKGIAAQIGGPVVLKSQVLTGGRMKAGGVKFAKKVLEAIPDGRGVHMIDGKMQDDATWKQCKVMVSLAEMLAEKDPELREAYGL